MEITWYLNNKVLNKSDGISILRDKKMITLSIDSVSFETAGNYTCLASNKAGIASYTTVLNVNGILKLFHFVFVIALKSETSVPLYPSQI